MSRAHSIGGDTEGVVIASCDCGTESIDCIRSEKPLVHACDHGRSQDVYPHPGDAITTVVKGGIRVRSHRAMGTMFCVYLEVQEEAEAQACFQAVFEEIDRIESTFSCFRTSSEISRINRLASHGPMVTDPEVFRLLSAALDVSEKTGGAFDISVGQLTRTWGFATHEPRIPAAQHLAAALESVGWNKVELDAVWRTVRFSRPGLELDLGAIAKGYALDCALEVLRSVHASALIDAGSSSIAAIGEPYSNGWKVSIANPVSKSLSICEVQLEGRALSTSGVTEQSFVHDGRIYSHLIDPTSRGTGTGAAGPQVLQVTVLASTSMLADALSTAMFVLGHQQGSVVLAQFPECSALWVYSDAEGITCLAHQWPEPDCS